MNNGCYRIVFNRALGVLQVVSELATGHAGGRSGPRRSLRPHRLSQACALLLATGLAGIALPAAAAVTCVPDATHLCGTDGGTAGAGTTGGGAGAGGAGSVGAGTYANNGGAGGSAYGGGSAGQGASGSGGAPGSAGNPGLGGAGGGLGTQGNGGGGGGGGAWNYYGGGGGGGGGGAGQYVGAATFVNPGSIYGGDGGDGGNGGFTYASAYGGGGGGGGAGIYATTGSSLTSGAGTLIRGGDGGAGGGGFKSASGGGGGAGVAGMGFTLDNGGSIAGGTGGLGGGPVSDGAYGGAGGAGGVGIAGSSLILTNTGSIQGGVGGAGGNDTSQGGNGGAGGAGVSISQTTLTNSGTISGGNGGVAGTASQNGATGAGGIGIASNGATTISNSGSISGGLSGDGVTRADAILFTGTGNTLDLLTGSNMTGNLELGASAQATIAAQNAGLTLDNTILLGSGSALDLNATTAGLDITGSINGNGALTLIGANTLGLATVDVASVQQDAVNNAVLNGNVTTSGAQTWDGNVGLGADVTLTSTGAGAIGLANVDGAHALTLNTAGVTALGAVGQTSALTSLTTDAAGSTQLDGNVTTSGAQTYNDAVLLGADSTLSSSGAGNISFNSTVDGGLNLVVNTGGTTVFGGVVGAATALASLTTDAGGSTQLDGNVTTSGAQQYNDSVALGANSALTGSDVAFGSTVDGNHVLNVVATGAVNFLGAVGGTAALSSLTASGATFSSASSLTVAGPLSVTTSAGGISQTGTFTVAGTSSLNAGSNAITLTNAGNDFMGVVSLSNSGANNVAITDANALVLGTSTVGSGTLDLTANGITQNGAIVQAPGGGAVTLAAGAGDLTLTNAGNDFTGSVTISSTRVALVDSNDLTIASLASGANADVSLVAGGTLSLPVGAIDTGTGSLTLASNGGSLSTSGALSGATIALTGRDGLVLANDVTGTSVTLATTNAAIVQTAGALTASTLTGSSGTGNVTLASASNAIGTLGDFSAGNFSLVDNQALAITGSLAASGDISLADLFGIDVTGSIGAGGSTTITAGTGVTIGNGSTVGAISGDVVDDGVLSFDHSDNVSFDDVLSGAGALHQIGTGTLTLDGDSSAFAGTTQVASGTLLVGSAAGNGAALGGDVSVDNGALLGGHGTIGGDVDLAGGAHLAPGNSIGTLTVGGDFHAAQGSVLDFEFGTPAADFTSSGNGDSVAVGGNLTLDGAVLNVTDAGGMGPGLYTLFTWGGTLSESNGGLAFGTLPAGTFQLQTLTGDKQINLLDTTGMTLNFWNGNGLATATSLGGGNGTWSTSSMTWTDADATVTAAMQPQPGFAIFGGAAGTVTVDNSDGAVATTGLQFASDGYTLQGDTLTLIGNGTDAPVIRVGAGSSAGAGYTATIGNVIAGSDGLAKTDAGTLVLTGANTFSGGLAIEGGALSVSSDANLGDAGNTVTLDGGLLQVTGTTFQSTARGLVLGDNGGGFDIADAANVFTVAQVLDGNGAFLKAGAGTLVLTGADTFTGGTTIGAGTLQLGAGGTTGSIAGDVVDNGTLAFDRSDAVTFAGTVSGTGGLLQQGTGTLVLTASNSFTGGTTIADGTLQLGNGGTTGSIAGDVADNGTLVFDRSDDIAFAGAISGSGALLQQGGGTLTLDGDSSAFAGSTDVQSGTLVVGSVAGNGAVLGGDLQVDSGATLGGHGAIGGSVVNAGTVAPGNSIGTLTIHGDYTQTATGTLAIEAQADGQADRLAVDGNASLDGSALVLAADGDWKPQTDYTILTAGGGVAGTFGSATSSLVFLDPVLNYDAHAVRLSLQRNDITFESAALTRNQRATAAGADGLGFGNSAYVALTLLSGAEAPQAFDALSGELHASVQTALMDDSRYLRGAMRERLDGVRGDGHGVWVSGWGHGTTNDSDGNAAALRTDGSGLVAGADTAVGADARIGVVVGVGHAYARVADRASRADVDSRHAGIYGRAALGGLQLQAGVARSWHDIASRRAAAFTGFGESLRGDNDAHTTQAYLDASHDFAVAKGTLSPFVDLAHVQVRSDGFTETGGDAALKVDATDTSRSFATAGVRGAFAFSDGWRVTGSLGWTHAFGGDASPKVREAFAAGGDAFLIAGVPIADNAVTVEAGLGYQATPAFRINAGYVGRYASDARDQGGRLTMAWSF